MPADKMPKVSVSYGVSSPDIFDREDGVSADGVAVDLLLISKFAVSVSPEYSLVVTLRSVYREVVDSPMDGVVGPSGTLPTVDAAFAVASSDLEALSLLDDGLLPPIVTELPNCVDKILLGLCGRSELDK